MCSTASRSTSAWSGRASVPSFASTTPTADEMPRILVVGLGSMGRRRLRNLTHIGGSDLAGFEPDDERRQSVGAETGLPVFSSFEDAIGWEPEALVISTPPD